MMKIRMKKECYQRRSQERHHKQRHDGNRCFGKNSLKRIHWLMLMEMILQKEKDLELAAQIGQSLLEQNHELQTRNEFLEEALNASNDIVVQLRHDLQTRSSLLRFYIDNDIDLDGCTSGQSNNENFQRKIKRLEDENENLKNESINLKKTFSEFEENERLRITEWTKQLDAANEKICRLQHLLAKKTEECGIQSFEVERLLREVAVRSNNEKALTNEAIDLQQKLQDVLAMHEELTAQVVELQERYTEVVAMLHDAEEELRTYRQNQSAYRTSTPDSLYDSLASEMEASDTGFNTAVNKLLTKQHESVRPKKETIVDVSNKLDLLNGSCDRADVVSMMETRSIATVTDSVLESAKVQQNSHNDDNIVDVPNHTLAKLLQHSRFLHPPASFLKDDDDPTTYPNTSNRPDMLLTSKLKTKRFDANASTSKSLQRRRSLDGDVSVGAAQHCSCSMYDCNVVSSESTSDSLSKTGSTNSLSGYEGLKMGEPGRPGTRDLDWSIQKLNIRRQIEREYARYRRERGLMPSNTPFFSLAPRKMISNSREKYHLSQQRVPHHVSSSLPSDELQKEEIAKNLLLRVFKYDKNFSTIGLFASLHHTNHTQGIVLRSSIPVIPTTLTPVPVNHQNFTRDKISASSAYLLEALALCTHSKAQSLSLTSKQLARFYSLHNLHNNLLATTETATTATAFSLSEE